MEKAHDGTIMAGRGSRVRRLVRQSVVSYQQEIFMRRCRRSSGPSTTDERQAVGAGAYPMASTGSEAERSGKSCKGDLPLEPHLAPLVMDAA